MESLWCDIRRGADILKYYYYPETVFTEIADAIRIKRRILDKISMENAPNEIMKIAKGAPSYVPIKASILEMYSDVIS